MTTYLSLTQDERRSVAASIDIAKAHLANANFADAAIAASAAICPFISAEPMQPGKDLQAWFSGSPDWAMFTEAGDIHTSALKGLEVRR